MAEVIITKQNFESEVLQSPIPVLVDFWATWCGPCRMLAPEVEALAQELDGKVKIGKLNVDEQESLAVKYRVLSIPTLILFQNGEIVHQTVGYMEKDKIKQAFGLE